MNFDSIYTFLDRYANSNQPVLLGLSGGPDSLFLLHQLLKVKKNRPLDLHLAHIDHRWRPESQQEASQLQLLAHQLQLPFHLKVLNPTQLKGNLEAACREERLKFFSETCQQYCCQAVLVAHHADDQAETVFKEIMEGKSLLGLVGLQEETIIDALKIWRPLLTISKKSILEWLELYQIKAFDDSTNLDCRFLRGKLRTRIFPPLVKEFGKEVSTNLCEIAEESLELRTYIEKKITPYLELAVNSEFGVYLDLQKIAPESAIELRYLVKQFCGMSGFSLSRQAIKQAVEMLASNLADRQIAMGHHHLIIDRKRLFISNHFIQDYQPCPLQEGEFEYGIWNVKIIKHLDRPNIRPTSWKDAWKGKCDAVVPAGELFIGPISLKAPVLGRHKQLSKWWTECKVPTFFRQHLPVIWDNDGIRHEFLSGKACSSAGHAQWLSIHMNRRYKKLSHNNIDLS